MATFNLLGNSAGAASGASPLLGGSLSAASTAAPLGLGAKIGGITTAGGGAAPLGLGAKIGGITAGAGGGLGIGTVSGASPFLSGSLSAAPGKSVSAAVSTAATIGGATGGIGATTVGVTAGGVGSAATTAAAGGASTAAAAAGTSKMTYKQLEEQINKWSLELEQQERMFLQQADHVSAWDRCLVQNGEKIIELNDSVAKVKAEQSALENELEFIASQQSELDEMLKPLEEAVRGQCSAYEHHADVEREKTYQLAENIDSQLKRMMQDLTEVIHHVNQSNGNSQAESNKNPMHQLARILNAHMDSLQWVDDNTSVLQRKVEDIRGTFANIKTRY